MTRLTFTSPIDDSLSNRRCAGFTIVEMLIALAIALAIMALASPAWLMIRNNARRSSSGTLVTTVALAIEAYHDRWITAVDASGTSRRWRAWDVDGNGIIDGDAGMDPGVPILLAEQAGYHGLFGNLHPDIPKRAVDPSTRRILDAWGQPLRIDFTADQYGSPGFGIWSTGPDRSDQNGQGDDLASWSLGR